MSAPTTTRTQRIDNDLGQAAAALEGARAAARHSPNGETTAAVSRAQRRVDELLDERWNATH